MPSGSLVRVGAWESGEFVGVVLFGHGAIHRIGDPYGLTQFQCVELVRIALREHAEPVSKIGAIAVRFLKQAAPALRLIVSYADPKEGHHGGIYQAMNWIYVGASLNPWIRLNGQLQHPRSIYATYGTRSVAYLRKNVDPTAELVVLPAKHKYLLPLDAEIRARILPLSKPYPKRAGSIVADAPADQAGEGGSVPTPALQRHKPSNP